MGREEDHDNEIDMGIPSSLSVLLGVRTEDVVMLSEVGRLVSDAMEAAGLPAVTAFELPLDARVRRGDAARLRAELVKTVERNVDVKIGAMSTVFLLRDRDDLHHWDISVSWCREDAPDLRIAIVSLLQFTRHILRALPVTYATVERSAGAAACLPSVPLAERGPYAVVVTEQEVAEAYEDPEAFWGAWDDIEEFGGLRLCSRALDAITSPDFLRAIKDGQWAMARAARAGFKVTPPLWATDAEMDIYMEGASCLDTVGYDADTAHLEVSCVLDPGQQIPGWELGALGDILDEEELEDGRPLASLRVIFTDRDSAHAEKRPLLDMRAQVAYLDEDGELVEVTDP